MTDREMLLLSYGAMKAVTSKGNISNLGEVVSLIEEHLYPPQVVLREGDSEDINDDGR